MKWFKFFKNFSTDPILQSMSEINQRRYLMLLCLQCESDIYTIPQNAQEQVISTFLRISIDELRNTKEALLNANLITKNWVIVNWKQHQAPATSAERTKKYRQRLAEKTSLRRHCDVTSEKSESTPNKSQVIDSKSKKEISNESNVTVTSQERHCDVTDNKKGSRIDPNMQLSEAMRNSATQIGLDESRVDLVFDSFKDYWISASGQTAIKRDWIATWRNWVRREVDKKAKKSNSLPRHFNNAARDYTAGTFLRKDGSRGF